MNSCSLDRPGQIARHRDRSSNAPGTELPGEGFHLIRPRHQNKAIPESAELAGTSSPHPTARGGDDRNRAASHSRLPPRGRPAAPPY